ncbi:hypothetical protein C0Q70_07868 [Pomacea canaliculata]|uniref:G-protein coupled receptors family 1 profile domain-containing protein n=1 Tax=Pomacea canaliculata TaxID=400727 RepID=A0A2T7PGA2_POMCA|nr:hypothetical protein C0Q70_07868 [Pomacea canaliculata]
MCSVDDQHKSSVLLLSYNAITGLAFVTCFTMIAVSYAQIGCHVWRHRKHVVGLNQAATAHDSTRSTSGDTSSTPQTQSSASTDVTSFTTATSNRPAETQGVKIDAAGARHAGCSEITSQPVSADSRPVAIGGDKDQAIDNWDASGVVCTTTHDPAVSASLTYTSAGHNDKDEVILHIPSSDCSEAVTNIHFHNNDTLLKSDTVKRDFSLDSPSSSSDQREVSVKTPVSGRRRSSDVHVAAVRALSRKRAHDVKITSQKGGHVREVASRTTLIMFMLTLVFVISFLPYWAIVFLRGALRFSEHGMAVWVFNVYLLGLHSFFISSATNAIVYGIFSAQFRRGCQHLLGTCIRRR